MCQPCTAVQTCTSGECVARNPGGDGGTTTCVGGGTGPQQGTDGGARQGYIQVQQNPGFRLALGAFYADVVPGGLLAGCTSTTIGPCIILDCPLDAGTGGAAPVSAGDIQVKIGSETISMTQVAAGFYSGSAEIGGWWADTITVTASGSSDGGAPAFTATLTAPARYELTAPVPTSVTRGADLPIAWSTRTPDYIQLIGAGSVRPVFCVPEPSSCSMTIPGNVTQLLTTGSGGIGLRYESNVVVTPSGWVIRNIASVVTVHTVVVQ
ncbi:MAG: hypothetical protein JNK82_45320 [Myxococcaceae bacterium]|nr:hypothetical protein [Myxococcaceae bacterium]